MKSEKDVNHSEEKKEGPPTASGSVPEYASVENSHSPAPSPTATDLGKPADAPGKLKLISRSSKLRKQLLKKIVPIAYTDEFKGNSPAILPFLSPFLEQKVDRIANLIEKLISQK